MSATNVSIRLGVEGKAEISQAFQEVGQSGQAAFGSVEKALARSGAATDREVARLKRLAEAARMAGAANASQRLQAFVDAFAHRNNHYRSYDGFWRANSCHVSQRHDCWQPSAGSRRESHKTVLPKSRIEVNHKLTEVFVLHTAGSCKMGDTMSLQLKILNILIVRPIK